MNIPMDSSKVQLESIVAKYDNMNLIGSASEIAIMQEQALIKRILDDLIWQQLDDTVKQESRKSLLVVMDKWSYEQGTNTDNSYEISVIVLYDYIEEVLKTISEDTPIAIRLKGALLVEKIFINEQRGFSKMKHFNPVAWNAIIDQSKQTDVGVDVVVLDRLFKEMYFKWPNRLYEDESYTEILP